VDGPIARSVPGAAERIYDPLMSRLGGMLAGLSGTVAVLTLSVAPAYAGGSFQDCLNKAADHNGEPPTCTKVNGSWVASWPDDASSSGMGGAIAFFVIVGVLITAAVTIWKVSTARRLAQQAGMDPGVATGMTLLTDDGLEATYLASSLRRTGTGQPTPATPAAGPTPTATARLEELKSLLDRGLVTQAEYDERRKAIIDSL
jgi:hypothetical protein